MRSRTLNTTSVATPTRFSNYTRPQPTSGSAYFHGLLVPSGGTTNSSASDFTNYTGKVGLVSSMTDEPKGGILYKAVSHVKEEWQCPAIQTVLSGVDTTTAGKPVYCTTTLLAGTYPGDCTFGIDSYSFGDSDTNAKLRAIAKQEFLVEQSGTNIPQFLGELKDFVQLFAKTKELFSIMQKERTRNKLADRQIQKLLQNPVRYALRTFATADLANQWVVKPLMSDYHNLMKAGRDLARQFDRIQSTKPLYAVGTVRDHSQGSSETGKPPSSTKHHVTRDLEHVRTVVAWSMWRIAPGTNISPPDRILLAADYFGFNQPHVAAWELLPFSWLVDYFVKVGDWLSGFGGGFLNLPIEIIQQGWSKKIVSTSTVSTRFYTGTNHLRYRALQASPEQVPGKLVKTRYYRYSEYLPRDEIPLPRIAVPNLRQVGNMAELLYLFKG